MDELLKILQIENDQEKIEVAVNLEMTALVLTPEE